MASEYPLLDREKFPDPREIPRQPRAPQGYFVKASVYRLSFRGGAQRRTRNLRTRMLDSIAQPLVGHSGRPVLMGSGFRLHRPRNDIRCTPESAIARWKASASTRAFLAATGQILGNPRLFPRAGAGDGNDPDWQWWPWRCAARLLASFPRAFAVSYEPKPGCRRVTARSGLCRNASSMH
jgi:hypothetical protein